MFYIDSFIGSQKYETLYVSSYSVCLYTKHLTEKKRKSQVTNRKNFIYSQLDLKYVAIS